jgi:hypothetical protein
MVVMGIIVLYFLSSFSPIKLDEHSRPFVLVVSASILGIFLIAVKEIEGVDRVLVESVEILLLIIIASVATFPLLSNPTGNLRYGAVLLMLTIGGWWGFYVCSRFIKIHEKEEKEKAKNVDAKMLEERARRRFRWVTIFFAEVWTLGIFVIIISSPIT